MQVNESQVDPVGRIDARFASVVGGIAAVAFVGGYIVTVSALGWGEALRELSMPRTFALVLAGLAVHEVVHGLGFRAKGIPWSKIHFGIMWKFLMPYATCSEPMAVENYRFALLLPGWITGLLPWLLGAALRDHEVAVAGAFLSAGAMGDWLIWRRTLILPRGTVVQDLTSEVGFGVVGGERNTSG